MSHTDNHVTEYSGERQYYRDLHNRQQRRQAQAALRKLRRPGDEDNFDILPCNGDRRRVRSYVS